LAIRATLFEQAGSMYRAEGPEELRSVGETEFVCGVVAMSASAFTADVLHRSNRRLCRFACWPRVKGVLERHIARWRRWRYSQRFEVEQRSSPKGFGEAVGPGLYSVKGFSGLLALDLTFDAGNFQTELGDVIALR
jgi:hypothetical protein